MTPGCLSTSALLRLWRSLTLVCLLAGCSGVLLWTVCAHAEAPRDRFSAAGYFRIMTRPDLQGGDSRLGYWNLYGRLLNEGPWSALELSLELLRAEPGTFDVWTRVHAKIEGGSVANADGAKGFLKSYRVTQLYAQAGNVLLDGVTWQLGTLEYYFGDLGLYDMRPASVFFDTVGLSGRYSHDRFDLLLGVGDAGYFVRGEQYSTVLNGGATLRLRLAKHLEVGLGGQYYHEPAVRGDRHAPHATPLPDGVTYEDFHRREFVKRFLEAFPGREADFPRPEPRAAASYRVVGYLGFGEFGPLVWNNLFANFSRRHPDNFYVETYEGREYAIYVKQLTDERHEVMVGNEMQLRLVPKWLDAAWGLLYGRQWNHDNTIAAGDDNREFLSSVLRLQLYLSPTVHLLLESSLALERSLQGNMWREHYDSVFSSSGGEPDARGLEFGDTAQRRTWQLKAGVVLNPVGSGIYVRPSLRILWGLQYCNVHNAFGSNFVASLDQYDVFAERGDRHWHMLIALEAEGWF